MRCEFAGFCHRPCIRLLPLCTLHVWRFLAAVHGVFELSSEAEGEPPKRTWVKPAGYVTLLPKDLHRHANKLREAMKQLSLPGLDPEQPGMPPRYWRPQTRGDCEDGTRPCPFVACRYNLLADITPAGSIRLPFGEDVGAMGELSHTCALDAAEAGGMTLEQVAALTNLTRERVRQIERMASAKLRQSMGRAYDGDEMVLAEDVDDEA